MVATTLVTAEELAARPEDERVELVEGEVVEVSPASGGHGVVVRRLAQALHRYLDAYPGPELWFGETGFGVQRHPDTVLSPDLALSLHDDTSVDDPRYVVHPPELVVEVRFPNDRESRIARKTGLYLAAGVREV